MRKSKKWIPQFRIRFDPHGIGDCGEYVVEKRTDGGWKYNLQRAFLDEGIGCLLWCLVDSEQDEELGKSFLKINSYVEKQRATVERRRAAYYTKKYNRKSR